MQKLAIVVDSSIALTVEQQKAIEDLFVAPLSIIHDNKEYTDQIDITVEEVQDILSKNQLIQTSQPSVGVVMELYEKIQALNYDHIFVLSLSSHLSGTYNSFTTAAKAMSKHNITVIDSGSIAGVIQESIQVLKNLNTKGKSISEIEKALINYFKETTSYVYPENLKQLKASGRISPAAAAVASLLKMKVLLRLANHGTTFEKFETARTDKKVFASFIKDLNAEGFDPKLHCVYILHSLNEQGAENIKQLLIEEYGDVEFHISFLPAAVAGHAGNGTLAVQWCRKNNLIA